MPGNGGLVADNAADSDIARSGAIITVGADAQLDGGQERSGAAVIGRGGQRIGVVVVVAINRACARHRGSLIFGIAAGP